MNTVTVVLNSETAKTVKYLMANASTDMARPVLNGFHIQNGKACAADGFKLVEVPTPDCFKDYQGQTLKPVSSIPACKAGTPILFEVIPGQYPDTKYIVDICGPKTITANIGFDPEYMTSIIKGMSAPVILEMVDNTHAMIIREKDGDKWAMLMPMRITD